MCVCIYIYTKIYIYIIYNINTLYTIYIYTYILKNANMPTFNELCKNISRIKTIYLRNISDFK